MELAVGEKTAQNIPFMGIFGEEGRDSSSTRVPRQKYKWKYREEWRGMELPEKGRSGPNPTVRL